MKYHYNYQDQYHEGPNIVRFLTDNGEDAQLGGETNMVGAWSGQKKRFWVEAQRHEKFALIHAIVYMKINGKIKVGEFGSGAPLTNGIKLYFYDGEHETYFDILDKNVIKVNQDWAKHAFTTKVTDYDKQNSIFTSHWSFLDDGGPVLLTPGDRIEVILDDDIDASRGITEMTLRVSGNLLEGELTPAIPQP